MVEASLNGWQTSGNDDRIFTRPQGSAVEHMINDAREANTQEHPEARLRSYPGE